MFLSYLEYYNIYLFDDFYRSMKKITIVLRTKVEEVTNQICTQINIEKKIYAKVI